MANPLNEQVGAMMIALNQGDLTISDLVTLVIQFQKSNKLKADGVVGPVTLAKIKAKG